MSEKILNTLVELENKSEILKGQILIYDQEIYQHRNTIQGQESTISQHQGIIVDLKNLLEAKELEKKNMLAELSKFNEEKTSLNENLVKSRKEFSELNKEIESKQRDFQEQKKHQDKIDKDLEKKKFLIEERETKVSEREILINEKHAKIKEFASHI